MRVRIPCGDNLSGFDRRVLTNSNQRAVGELITLALAALCVIDNQFTGSRHYDKLAFDVFHRLHVVQMHSTGVLHLNAVVSRRA